VCYERYSANSPAGICVLKTRVQFSSVHALWTRLYADINISSITFCVVKWPGSSELRTFFGETDEIIITPPLIEERSTVMTVSVCLSVCLRTYLRKCTLNLHQLCACYLWPVAEWLACWTQAQKGPRSNRNSDALSSNSLRQTVHTHCASVHQAAKFVAALLRVSGVTAGLVESNGSLPSGLWFASPASWLPRTGISSVTLRSVIEYGLPLPFFTYGRGVVSL